MVKHLKNKVYNTKTARQIARHSDNLGLQDFKHVEEDLYCKKTGEYFLHVQGGALSKYARTCADGMPGYGEKIIPLTFDQARDWGKKYMSTDDYTKEFGAVSENDTTTVLSISMPKKLADTIRRRAKVKGTTISGLIADMFR